MAKAAGRKRLKSSSDDREPNGRLSRRVEAVEARKEETAKEARQTATEARVRLFGVPKEVAHKEIAGTVVGRLRIGKEISEKQYQAAIRACRVKNDYERALGLTKANAFKFLGSTDNYEEWYAEKLAGWDALKAAVREAQCELSNRGANLYGALDYVVFQDQDLIHMLCDLRICLNVLHRHFVKTSRGLKSEKKRVFVSG